MKGIKLNSTFLQATAWSYKIITLQLFSELICECSTMPALVLASNLASVPLIHLVSGMEAKYQRAERGQRMAAWLWYSDFLGSCSDILGLE
jgi:hypothetical protein